MQAFNDQLRAKSKMKSELPYKGSRSSPLPAGNRVPRAQERAGLLSGELQLHLMATLNGCFASILTANS